MKKLHLKPWIFFLGLIILNSSCLKKDDCGGCFTPPPQLTFKAVNPESGENLYNNSTYTSGKLKLFYIADSDTNYLNVNLFQYVDQLLITSNEMSLISLANNGETFYLELDPDTIETIYLKIVAVFENCCTYHIVEELTVNGDVAEIDPYTNSIIIKIYPRESSLMGKRAIFSTSMLGNPNSSTTLPKIR